MHNSVSQEDGRFNNFHKKACCLAAQVTVTLGIHVTDWLQVKKQ